MGNITQSAFCGKSVALVPSAIQSGGHKMPAFAPAENLKYAYSA